MALHRVEISSGKELLLYFISVNVFYNHGTLFTNNSTLVLRNFVATCPVGAQRLFPGGGLTHSHRSSETRSGTVKRLSWNCLLSPVLRSLAPSVIVQWDSNGGRRQAVLFSDGGGGGGDTREEDRGQKWGVCLNVAVK